MRDFLYDGRKPPLFVKAKLAPFICQQCLKPGIGNINSKVHPGECRRLWGNAISRRNGARRRQAKAAAG